MNFQTYLIDVNQEDSEHSLKEAKNTVFQRFQECLGLDLIFLCYRLPLFTNNKGIVKTGYIALLYDPSEYCIDLKIGVRPVFSIEGVQFRASVIDGRIEQI